MTRPPRRRPARPGRPVPPRRRSRQRLRLSDLSGEAWFPIGLLASVAIGLGGLFLKTTARHWPTWTEMGASLVRGGVTLIGVVVALAVVAVIAWRKL